MQIFEDIFNYYQKLRLDFVPVDEDWKVLLDPQDHGTPEKCKGSLKKPHKEKRNKSSFSLQFEDTKLNRTNMPWDLFYSEDSTLAHRKPMVWLTELIFFTACTELRFELVFKKTNKMEKQECQTANEDVDVADALETPDCRMDVDFNDKGWNERLLGLHDYKGGFCEKLPVASPMTDRANASQLQDGQASPTSDCGSAPGITDLTE
ncbi:hypothetical protein DUI87_18360 [Hirundo rustica rustica]|uniref:Uncharacterized protein n=1 Tax=Hirundo rustica rustica TaxID=333673 RepID=A0A3M0JW18_HIRRU|nr:hypothetical protein DUI87_18360 [Hirundo rustica rustica]